MPRRPDAAVGFSVHTGWAAAVAVTAAPAKLLLRERVVLARDPHMRFVFHASAEEPLTAKKRVAEAEAWSRDCAVAFLKRLQKEWAGKSLVVALPPQKRALPPLEAILQSHPLLHTAEGVLYRRAIAEAAETLKIPLVVVGAPPGEAPIANPGPPWGKDQRAAAALAWAAVSAKPADKRA